ncbi:MAG: DUF1963 domain-containing protein [Chloroflexota bacterium]|nr:DUF1963 domain-containing protein [Chloroflexota bacterium]
MGSSAWWNWLYTMLDSAYPEHRHFWFGHPDNIQCYVEWDVIIRSREVKPQPTGEHEEGNSDEQIAYIRSQMAQWQFLFQIGSDDSLNVLWGDAGTLYVCIPKISLAVLQFEGCWTILQS